MGLPIVVILAVLAIVACVFWALKQRVAGQADKEESVASPRTETLEYVVPPGQDPAVLVAALSKDGYTAVADSSAQPMLRIDVPQGRDRERAHVRAIISNVRGTSFEGGSVDTGEARFEDERQG